MPLSLTSFLLLILLVSQLAVITTVLRQGRWRAVPGWGLYLGLATLHLLVGIFGMLSARDYPLELLYFEPAFLLGQIAVTFESGAKFAGVKMGTGSTESRLLMWLIPMVPAAIVVPIEIGFIQDALAGWNSEAEASLRLVYDVRRFLSLTLLVVLAAIPVVARISKRVVKPAVAMHHYIVTAYVMCGALGYLCKIYTRGELDLYITNLFFILGPLVCFATWSWWMWQSQPADLVPDEMAATVEIVNMLDRGVVHNL